MLHVCNPVYFCICSKQHKLTSGSLSYAVAMEAQRLTRHFGQNQDTRQHLPTQQHCSGVASGPDIMCIIEAAPDPPEVDHLAKDLRQAPALLVPGHHHMPACLDAVKKGNP